MNKYNDNVARDYYDQFMEREYNKILSNSAFTGIGKLFVSVPVIKDIIPTVWAQKQEELDFLKAALKNPMKYNEVLGDYVDCESYDPVVVKYGTEIIMNYQNIYGSTIYLPRYGFNAVIDNGVEYVEDSRAYVISKAKCNVEIINVYVHQKG